MPHNNDLLDAYRQMLTIRIFEETVEKLFAEGVIKGTAHPSVGQEAVAVGACGALRKGDYVTSTHRCHGHFIACGGEPRRIMAELFGKKTGYSRGRGGSQIMAAFELGFLGSNGITGGGIPVATGAALSAKLRKTGAVALCFFGDGAANQGAFHESLNMAAVWKLPAVYLCENNFYAMSAAIKDTVAIDHIADRAAGYGMPGYVVDGNDLFEVDDFVVSACERARAGDGPTLLECKTYRFLGHSRGDQRLYRSREEEEAWKKNDPITRLAETLSDKGLLTAERDEELRAEVNAVVDDAIEFAHESAEPDVEFLEDGIFA